MESAESYWAARAALDWQIELGAVDAICDAPVDRYALQPTLPKAGVSPGTADPAVTDAGVVATPAGPDPVAEARARAEGAATLDALRAAMGGFEHCALKRGARNLVFGAGHPGARVMILGEAPDREEDREGQPFVGRTGVLLDRMLSAIGLDRHSEGADAVYVAPALPWRPPHGRDPEAGEIAMMRPFVQRHIALVAPEFLICMGASACASMLDKRGVARLRGQWQEVDGMPVLPMVHPEHLLRNPASKREAWADLLSLKARLENGA